MSGAREEREKSGRSLLDGLRARGRGISRRLPKRKARRHHAQGRGDEDEEAAERERGRSADTKPSSY